MTTTTTPTTTTTTATTTTTTATAAAAIVRVMLVDGYPLARQGPDCAAAGAIASHTQARRIDGSWGFCVRRAIKRLLSMNCCFSIERTQN
jgi:hypothetical protein